MAKTTRFLILGDMHGRMPHVYAKKFDAVIAVGDFCSDAPRKWMFEVMKRRMENPRYKKEWTEIVGKKKAKKMMEKQWQDGRKTLNRLNQLGKWTFIVPGNWDFAEEGMWHLLHVDLDNLIDCHGRAIETDQLIFIGYGVNSGPEIPLGRRPKNKRERRMISWFQDMHRYYDKMFRAAKKARKPVIFLSHNVPYGTGLDLITDKRSPLRGEHAGSVLARKIIEKWQPLACIGGHMHEHFKAEKIGRTICVNAGFGTRVNVAMDVKGKKVAALNFLKDGKRVK